MCSLWDMDAPSGVQQLALQVDFQDSEEIQHLGPQVLLQKHKLSLHPKNDGGEEQVHYHNPSTSPSQFAQKTSQDFGSKHFSEESWTEGPMESDHHVPHEFGQRQNLWNAS